MVGLAPASKNAPSGVQPTSFPGLCTAEERRIANYEWRKLLDDKKILWATRAVRLDSRLPLAVSVNFSPKYENQSFDWQRRRLIRLLQEGLGRRVEIVAVRDFTADGRAHLHAALSAHHPAEIELIRVACQRAGGEWNNRQGAIHQVDVGELYYPDGWAGYVCRNLHQGGGWTMTNPLRDKAKRLLAEEVHQMTLQKSKFINPKSPS